MNKNVFLKLLVYTFLYVVTIGVVASTLLIHPIAKTPYPLIRTIIIFFATVLLTKYFIYMVLSPFYDVWAKRRDKKFAHTIATYRPKVSVIIPAWNEEVGIVPVIESVLASTYTPLEVIVVNDGSTDDTDLVVRKFLDDYREGPTNNPEKTLLYHKKENGGKGRALNAGIAISTGEIIVSIDADCYVTPEAVDNFVKCFADPNVMAAVGNVKIGNTRTILGTVQYLEFLFSFYFKKADSLLNTIYIIGGAAGAFRREVFESVGVYTSRHITEDIDLSVRIQKAGMRIIYAADAIVYTEGASDLAGLAKQRLRWKRGRFQTFWEHRALFFSSTDGQSKLLTWLVLPLALFGDLQLFGEMFFLTFLYFYSLWTNNFSSFISGIVVVSSMFIVQIFADKSRAKKLSLILMAPIGWLLFYISTFVEHDALIKSIWSSITNQRIKWQTWRRRGVADA
jgi:biofilm PGA synthesis N-glycosyltransferase PgaC